jgi:hypothetical protein
MSNVLAKQLEESMVKFPDVPVATTSSAFVGTCPSTQVSVADQFPPALEMVRVAAIALGEKQIAISRKMTRLVNI